MITTTETFNAWIKSNDCNTNGLSLYVENVTDLYLMFEWLQNACIKKFKKYSGLDMDLLVNSSCLKSITRAARKYAKKYEENFTMEDDKQARRRLASVIFVSRILGFSAHCGTTHKGRGSLTGAPPAKTIKIQLL